MIHSLDLVEYMSEQLHAKVPIGNVSIFKLLYSCSKIREVTVLILSDLEVMSKVRDRERL